MTDARGETRPRYQARSRGETLALREEWRSNAVDWIAWARAPGHDSYWRFHREQFFELIPAPGRLTLDIGAGEGRVSRDLRRLGHNVLALDVVEAMVVAAREADPSIPAAAADAALLPLRDQVAELAVAFMSLQDVDDLAGAIAEIGRVLQPGGRLCAAVVHPLNSAGEFAGEDPAAPFVIQGSYLHSTAYIDDMTRDGQRMRFASRHRPVQAYFDALHTAGLLVEQLREPPVPENAVRSARDRRWQRLPLFLHVVAVRK